MRTLVMALTLLSLHLSSHAVATPPVLLNRTDYAAGTGPWSAASGDLNGDGQADLAITDYGGNALAVLIGNGSGGFAAPVTYTAGLNPVSVSIGYLNLDSNPDLVVCNWSQSSFSVFLGTGGGAFAPKVDYATASSRPISGQLADLDGDGAIDFVLALRNTGQIEVRLGNGAGGFGASNLYSTGAVSFPYAIALADLNNDSALDLAVGSDVVSNTVSVLLGNGAGGFGAATPFTVGSQPSAVALGDLNGDGAADLVATGQNAATVSLLLGNGAGGFGPKTDFAVGAAPFSVAIGDLNLDGLADLAVANATGNTLSVLRGNGAGGFDPSTDFAVAAAPRLLTLNDWNGDGRTDVAVPSATTNSVSVLLNNTDPPAPFCPENVVANGDFSDGLIPGSMPGGAVDQWSLLTQSPQVVTDGCAAPGAMQMWGNQVVGESIQQQLPGGGFIAGKTYRISVCYRWLDNNPILPQYVRFRLAAASSAPGNYPPPGGYAVIGITPNTSSTFWTSYTFPDWTPTTNAAWITVNPENDSFANDGNFVSWGQIDDICIQEVGCDGVANGDFTDGLVPGSMPGGGAVDQWSQLTQTPQVVTDGCEAPGAMQMWGNQVVGESIKQSLPGLGFQAGRTYRVTVCYRWLDNNPILPQYVRFRLAASGPAPTSYPPVGGYAVIGVTPNTSNTNWTTYTFPDWTPTSNAYWITVNPENDSFANDGNFVSWGQIDDICIEELPCAKVSNPHFTEGLIPGSMPIGAVDDWSVLTASPQVVTDGCGESGALQMWGNLVVGESVQQTLPGVGFQAGHTYSVSVCYRWLDNNPNLPQYVRMRLSAPTSAPAAYPPVGGYPVIGITPNTSNTNWTTYTFPNWTCTANSSYITINPENDSSANDGNFVSWGLIDDICIQDVTPPNPVLVTEEPLGPGRQGNLRFLGSGPNPTSGEVAIRFAVARPSAAELTIYDINGARVHRARSALLPGGYHQMTWNGVAGGGAEMAPAGVYYFRLSTGSEEVTGKLVRLR